MGADLFESFVGSIIATIALAEGDILLSILSIWVAGCGIVASMIGYFAVHANDDAGQKDLMRALLKGTMTASILILRFSAVLIYVLFGERSNDGWKIYCCICIGLVAGVLIGQVTDYFTSYSCWPTR